VLEYIQESDTYRHIEIKSKSSIRNKNQTGAYTTLKPDLKQDISFSAYILAKNDIPISEHVMVFLNKGYVLDETIDFNALFVSEKINHELMSETEIESKILEMR
jgi:hypothetical protein